MSRLFGFLVLSVLASSCDSLGDACITTINIHVNNIDGTPAQNFRGTVILDTVTGTLGHVGSMPPEGADGIHFACEEHRLLTLEPRGLRQLARCLMDGVISFSSQDEKFYISIVSDDDRSLSWSGDLFVDFRTHSKERFEDLCSVATTEVVLEP